MPVHRSRHIGRRPRVAAHAWCDAAPWRDAPALPIATGGATGGATGDAPATALRDVRLVVVAPHPDDELLACGGLIASVLAAGGSVRVVAVTDGEASHGPARPAARRRLAHRRDRERRAGLRALGAARGAVRRLGLPDGAVARHERTLARRLGALLTDRDLVVVTARFDGHPDHEACARAAARAARRRGARLLQAPVWMWHWSRPDDRTLPWHALRHLELPAPLAARKRRALRHHRSQHERGATRRGPVLDAAIRARIRWPREFFFVDAP